MNAKVWLFALGALGNMAHGADPVTPAERALCQGPYPVLLMTDLECRLYIQRLGAAEQAGNLLARSSVAGEHDALLRERAEACPCVPGGLPGGC